MEVLQIIIGALVLIVSIVIILAVLFQKGHRAGVNGAISGAADTFLSRNDAKTVDGKLLKFTKIMAIVFFVLVLAANAIRIFIK